VPTHFGLFQSAGSQDVDVLVVPPGLLDQLEPNPTQRDRLGGAEDSVRRSATPFG
jgi:hypothetical protein